VAPVLAAADAALDSGLHVAGYLAYEAAAAFGLCVHPADDVGPPLVWFGVFGSPRTVEAPTVVPGSPLPAAAWRPLLDGAGHARALERIQARIARGDTYQVNFTWPIEGPLLEDPWDLFARLLAVQPAPYASFLDLGRYAVASVSPELFFARDGTRLRARPMKGTALRGVDLDDDARAVDELRASAKNRAENLMIVDMLRNDLGRVAETGSVTVPALFEIERYPTLLQMTSSVEARSRAPLSAVLAALFPCASVTGAPKVRTMEIISELEGGPRGLYTGAIGWAGPERATFGVAIRTAVADTEDCLVRYGVGSGIVADSSALAEYAECLLKARILEETPFALLETLAFLPGTGYRRLERHLARLRRSAAYFGLTTGDAAEGALRELAPGLGAPSRVRLLVDLFGRVRLESGPLGPTPTSVRLGRAPRPVDLRSPWLRHKTTRREVYDEAARGCPDADDVLLFNARGEVTESTIANVAVEGPDSVLVTPSLECGPLPGVERAALLAAGRLREGVIRLDDLAPGQRLWLMNSVRGLYPATFVG
jgi:para-aminobenzoate synthetase/4-amino-4-deoxychorismate lyase